MIEHFIRFSISFIWYFIYESVLVDFYPVCFRRRAKWRKQLNRIQHLLPVGAPLLDLHGLPVLPPPHVVAQYWGWPHEVPLQGDNHKVQAVMFTQLWHEWNGSEKQKLFSFAEVWRMQMRRGSSWSYFSPKTFTISE